MKNFKKGHTIIFAFVITVALYGCRQNKLELLVYDDRALDGYTVLCATGLIGFDIPPLIILDMEGNIIPHNFTEVTGYLPKMMPGGTIVGPRGMMSNGFDDLEALVQESWDGTLEWSFSEWEQKPGGEWSARGHHDFQREGSSVGYYAPGQSFIDQGNTLILAHKNEIRPEICPNPLLNDIIYEIDWYGTTVFEWNAADHVDEFGFDEAEREAIAANAPPRDWLHVNAISWLGENPWHDGGDGRFHPRNILFSSPQGPFIAIIDYETGEVVWRVGPDYSPDSPEAGLGPIIGQHHAHMIPNGLPGEGNILVFDNGGNAGYAGSFDLFNPDSWYKYTRYYSRILEFNPVTLEIVWEYNPTLGDFMPFSGIVSSAQRLLNGNTLITSGNMGIMLEVTPEKEIVWHYTYSTQHTFKLYRAIRTPPEWIPGNPAGYSAWESQG